MKLAVALLLAPAAAYVPLRPTTQRASTMVRAEEPEKMDLDLGEMFELFDEADPEGVAEREAAKKAEADAAAKEAAKLSMMVEGASAPFGFWDPAGLSKLGTPATQAWFKAAELKHSRVAMAATVGWIVNEAGIVFDGNIATGVPFSSLGKGVQAWENVPDAGKLQIILAAGAIEFASEAKQPHYMRGGRPGQTAGPFGLRLWDPLNYNGGMDEETKATKRQMEVNNGRLAMIGAASFVAAPTRNRPTEAPWPAPGGCSERSVLAPILFAFLAGGIMNLPEVTALPCIHLVYKPL